MKTILFAVVLCLAVSIALRFIFFDIPDCKKSLSRAGRLLRERELKYSKLFPYQRHILDSSKFKLHIKVLTYNRIASVLRCLKSLEDAIYDGDDVSLDIFVDHSYNLNQESWNKKSLDRTLVTHEVLKQVDDLEWTHGEKRIHFQSHNEGIQPQWIEAWWPESVNDFAFVVEDDMEVSPLFYRFFKKILFAYYYNHSSYAPNTYGISFQRQTLIPGIKGYHLSHEKGKPFLYQLVGTWGQFLFPAPWKEFRLWYDIRRYNMSRQPFLLGMKTNKWFIGKGNKLWTPWIIKWAYATNMFNIYPTFLGNKSLTVSHREVGSNFKIARGVDASLYEFSDLNFVKDYTFPIPSHLPRLDYCGRKVPWTKLSLSFNELDLMLKSAFKSNTFALVMVPNGAYDVMRNWLCHIDGIKLDYILVSTSYPDALDLYSRGHYVHYLSNEKGQRIVEASNGNIAWTRYHVQLILFLLATRYDIIVTNPYAIWHSDPTPSMIDQNFDIVSSLSHSSFSESLLGLRSSKATITAWTRIVKIWENNASEDTLLVEASKLFQSSLNLKFVGLAPFMNLSSFNLSSKYVPVSRSAQGSNRVQRIHELKAAGLWIIDDHDFACLRVTCRKKLTIG